MCLSYGSNLLHRVDDTGRRFTVHDRQVRDPWIGIETRRHIGRLRRFILRTR